MNSLALIWQALEMGAQAAARTVGSKAVKDAYKGFKALLRRKLPQNSAHVLSKSSTQLSPDEKRQLKTTLEKAEVHKNRDVVDAAHKLMILIDPQNSASRKYKTQVEGNVQGLVQGDNATSR